jgi:hypothetical protein
VYRKTSIYLYISSPKSSFGTNYFEKSEKNAFFFDTGLNPFLFGPAQSITNAYRKPIYKVLLRYMAHFTSLDGTLDKKKNFPSLDLILDQPFPGII